MAETVDSARLVDTAERAARVTLELYAGGREYGLGVMLAGDEYVRGLNRQYRGADYDTDVLAFPMLESGENQPGGVLGDVVVSLETAARQADEYGHGLATELALLVAHGVLHLLGYNDDTPAGEEAMWVKQREVLAQLGPVERTT
jgi:rRNA maturation RNase YbeY